MSDCGAWQPIETAPRDGTHVLLFERGRDDVMETGRWRADLERWAVNNNAFWVVNPTHWMPLPPPPSDHSLSDVGGEIASRSQPSGETGTHIPSCPQAQHSDGGGEA